MQLVFVDVQVVQILMDNTTFAPSPEELLIELEDALQDGRISKAEIRAILQATLAQ